MVSSPQHSPPMRQIAQPPLAQLPPAELLQRLQSSLSHFPPASESASSSYSASERAPRDGVPSYYHYPSRLGTVAVPNDAFAPSQSSASGSPVVAGRESWEERSRDSLEGYGDRRAFSPGNTYDYNRNGLSPIAGSPMPGSLNRSGSSNTADGLGAGPGAASGWGWEKEGGRRKRNKRFLYCLIGLAVVGLAVGLGVGLTRHSPSNRAAEPVAASRSDSLDSSSSSPSTSPTSSESSSPASPTPTPAFTAAAMKAATQTTVFTYVPPSNTAITSVALLYTIPTSGVATRDGARSDNGYLQFTNNVELPDGSGGTFTSALRMRVYTSGLKTSLSETATAKATATPKSIAASTATAGAVRERRAVEKLHSSRRH